MSFTKRIVGAAIVIASSGSLGCTSTGGVGGPGDGEGVSFPSEPLVTVTSLSSRFSIEVRTAPSQPPSRGNIAVDYRIVESGDAGKDLASSGDVTVVPWMPEMGHGSSTTPTVTAMGDGRFVITNVVLLMPGLWDLRTTIDDSSATSDTVTPSFQIP